jgi:hypothetical protein
MWVVHQTYSAWHMLSKIVTDYACFSSADTSPSVAYLSGTAHVLRQMPSRSGSGWASRAAPVGEEQKAFKQYEDLARKRVSKPLVHVPARSLSSAPLGKRERTCACRC